MSTPGYSHDTGRTDEEPQFQETDPALGAAAGALSVAVPAAGPSVVTNARWYVVTMFSLTTALLFADQNLLAPNLQEAADDFEFDDKQKDFYLGGLLSVVFFLVGAPASVLVGYLMGSRDRRLLLWACVLVGEAPCMATVFVTRYWQLLLTRCLTGIAVGGAAPLIYSILSDLYPPSERAVITTVVVISTGAGAGIGQALAGLLALDWRMPFLLVAVLGVAVATVMVATTSDPKRGRAEAALAAAFEGGAFEYEEQLTWAKCARILRIPTNCFIILQGFPGCLPWGMMMAFMNDYLIQEKGLSKAYATPVVLLFGAGSILGAIAGGGIGQRLYNWRRGHICYFTGICVWLGMPVLLWLVNGDVKQTPAGMTVVATFLGGSVASVAGVTLRPLIMNVNEPETRGMALSLHATLDDIGKGFGPAIVASLISAMGRAAAFNVAVAGWLPCGLLILCAGCTLPRDEDAMQRRLTAIVTESASVIEMKSRRLGSTSADVAVGSLDVQ